MNFTKAFIASFCISCSIVFACKAHAYLDPEYDFQQLNTEPSKSWVRYMYNSESSLVWMSGEVEGHWGSPYPACVAANAKGFKDWTVDYHGLTNTVTGESTTSNPPTPWHILMKSMNLDTQMRCEAGINGVYRPGYTIYLDDHPAPCQVLAEDEALIIPVAGWYEGELVTFADVVSEVDDLPDGRWDIPMYSTMQYWFQDGIPMALMKVFKAELDGAFSGNITEIRYQVRPVMWTEGGEADEIRGCAKWAN